MPDDLPPRRRATAEPPAPPVPKRPLNWRVIRVAAVVAVILLLAWAYSLTRERPVNNVSFTIREESGTGGNEASLRASSAELRFFEGGTPMPPLNQRQYAKTFAAGSTRYIYPEIELTSEAPGRVVIVPMSCEIFSRSGAVSGAVTINGEIQPDWKVTYHAHGYGNAQPGTWKPGHYRVDCKYGDKLINRGWFDVTDAATAAGTPSAPPSGPVAVVPPLRDINARLTLVRFFESGYGATPLDQRQYASSFLASTARYINVEVNLNHTAPGQITNATIYCRYLRDGSIEVARVQIHFTIQPAWITSTNADGWGARSPGYWRPGSYQVVCDDGRQTLGQAGFDVR